MDGAHEQHHGHNHDHGALLAADPGNRTRLTWVLAITITVLVVEVVGAVIADSLALLADAAARVRDAGWQIVNVDVVVIAERPKIGPHAAAMQTALAGPLGVDPAVIWDAHAAEDQRPALREHVEIVTGPDAERRRRGPIEL